MKFCELRVHEAKDREKSFVNYRKHHSCGQTFACYNENTNPTHMIHTFEYKDTKWLDIENPTKDDVEYAIEHYDIDRHTAHELVSPSRSPEVQLYKNYLYIVLHFPSFRGGKHTESPVQEIDFVLTKQALITARFDHIDVLHHVGKQLETEAIVQKEEVANTPSYIFFRLIRELYGALSKELQYIDTWTNDIESKIFKGHEREMVVTISQMSRTLIDLERTLAQHKDVLETLKEYGAQTFGDYFKYHVQAVLHEHTKILHMVSTHRDVVGELRETNNSLLSLKQNETAKVIAVLALIAVPMSLIVSIFQIETKSRPIIGLENDFWILVGIILLVGTGLFVFFKHKQWL